MSTSATALQSVPATHRTMRFGAYINEARFDLLKMLRLPMYSVASIAFPVMFYVLFGVVFGKQGGQGPQVARYLLGSYGAFGVIGASLFGFGVGVAVERGQGWLQVKRASPMPPSAYFIAKLFTCMVFSTAIVLILMLVGVIAALGGRPASTPDRGALATYVGLAAALTYLSGLNVPMPGAG